jgi:hypothetical protein
MMTSGLSAMIRLAAALELDAENTGRCMETLSIGQTEGFSGYVLEIAGAHLCYSIAIGGGQVFVGASLVDSISQPETLLQAPDSEQGWELVFRFISSLEKHEVKSLQRPIVFGTPGEPDAWVIS